ncbi:hypothetical protein OKA05_27240 [Luteolibacter arcticus]|uniref:Uncharacterized protein n=1 Tax=Luteolibacter arcticus TaxID=1581411 RepID=A0ABT3GRX1_9BACT|nr:hypothetical protein [Luteolibacter arcticus]MCW1926279.1 hypothetical protein [Luteolibacter arcticus]
MVPDPPVSIDLTGGGSGLWPAFTLSGVTGTHAAALNLTYVLSAKVPEWRYTGPGDAEVFEATEGEWQIANDLSRFSGFGTWPWTVTTWAADNDGAGTPALTRALAEPVAIDLGSESSAVAATLATNLSGSNNDLAFTAVLSGRLGNDVTVSYVSPGTNNASLGVVVSGRDITVKVATNGSAAITSTAAQVKTALEASGAASALVTVANKASNDGSGVVTALTATALSGGAGGLPLPPAALTL